MANSMFGVEPANLLAVAIDDEEVKVVDLEYQDESLLWVVLLGCAGLMDLAACVLPRFVLSDPLPDQSDFSNTVKKIETGNEWHFPEAIVDSAQFLNRYSLVISLVFSFLWFMNAFSEASRERKKALLQAERKHLFSPEQSKLQEIWKAPNFVYFRGIAKQLLLLPLGFYSLSYFLVQYTLQEWYSGSEWDGNKLWNVTLTAIIAPDTFPIDIGSDEFYNNNNNNLHSATSKKSLIFVCIYHSLRMLSEVTKQTIQKRVQQWISILKPKIIMSIVGRAMRRPLAFRRNVSYCLTLVRWIKYLSPLIGAINKFKVNIQDMLKKRRQRLEAEKQKRIRQMLWGKQPPRIQRQEAAIRIQSAYRAYRSRKATHALMLFRCERKYFATVKIQRAFRKALDRARERLREKKEQLERLRQLRQEGTQQLSDEANRQFFKLQDEFGQKASDLVNRKLLMRPNTRFSVLWRLAFACCILLDVARLMAQPWMDSYKSRRNGVPITMSEFIALSVVPTKVSQREECGYIPKSKGSPLKRALLYVKNRIKNRIAQKDKPWYCLRPISTIQEAFSDITALLLVPHPVSEWPECQVSNRWHLPWHKAEQKSWFCNGAFQVLHAFYRQVVDFWQEEFLFIVSCLAFLDVFINFFTGELDEVTGELRPKPFVARWISPGLLVQLLVNPAVATFASIVGMIQNEIVNLGPIRVLRWCSAVIIPAVCYIWIECLKYIWIPLVRYENQFRTNVKNMW